MGHLYGLTVDPRRDCARYVVTMAPEVAGRIVELHVVDNGYVRKGDLLMVIDPTNYKIDLALAEATLKQTEANAQNAEAQAERRRKLTTLSTSVEEKQTFNANALATNAQTEQAQASLDQARVNLERTEIRSPVERLCDESFGPARRLRRGRQEHHIDRGR